MIAGALLLLFAPGDVEKAEDAYRRGAYEAAFALFERALTDHAEPPGALLYNLGNCAYRLERHAEAVLFFRRAELRLPGDEEVLSNLRLAQLKLGVAPPQEAALSARALAGFDALPALEQLALVGALQGAGLLGLVLARRRSAKLASSLPVLLAMAGAARLAWSTWRPDEPAGVVLADVALIRKEPHTDADVALRLAAGEGLRIENDSGPWIRIRHPTGRGWTQRDAVGIVD